MIDLKQERKAYLVKFHISHLYEVQNNYKKAKEGYEQLLGDKQLTQQLKADVCRQLGKILQFQLMKPEYLLVFCFRVASSLCRYVRREKTT